MVSLTSHTEQKALVIAAEQRLRQVADPDQRVALMATLSEAKDRLRIMDAEAEADRPKTEPAPSAAVSVADMQAEAEARIRADIERSESTGVRPMLGRLR